MDQIKELQHVLEDSLVEINRQAMIELAAQLAATVEQLRNGGTSKVMLMWEAKHVPEAIQHFIKEKWTKPFVYAVLLPLGKDRSSLELARLAVVELELPQNKLLLYYVV